MAKNGLRSKIALQADYVENWRHKRDLSLQHKRYQLSLKGLNILLDKAITLAAKVPDEGILFPSNARLLS